PAVFPTYAQWVDRISAYMDSRQDYPELCGYMREANALCRALCERYESPMLLHGDFHHDNILLVSDGQYRIIDPKGVVGDPLFDIPRFLLNECRDECSQAENRRRVSALVDALCARLNLPAKDLRTAFFIEMAMAHCWSVESNEEPNMEDVVMAYEIMRAS
ncbi:MAG TPA: aminoglycoside phosphotransferase family protein, partial [Clostridia bacterium]|nr:aminoglycoside phosphotransferase family protein [Clostridia bacterium]